MPFKYHYSLFLDPYEGLKVVNEGLTLYNDEQSSVNEEHSSVKGPVYVF